MEKHGQTHWIGQKPTNEQTNYEIIKALTAKAIESELCMFVLMDFESLFACARVCVCDKFLYVPLAVWHTKQLYMILYISFPLWLFH